MRRKWVAIYGVYGAVLVLFASLIAAESDASAATKLGEGVALIAVPAVAFALAAIPVQRSWRDPVVLLATCLFAVAVGVALVIVSWGVLLPVSAGLFAVAVADFNRLLVVTGWTWSRTTVGAVSLAVVVGALLGVALPVVGLLIVLAIGIGLRKRYAGGTKHV
jgi:hypothetical protein